MLLAATLLAVPRAWAWGCEGHQVVALIALAHLSPEVRAEVDAILAGDARDPSTAACPAAGLPPMAAVANWADQVRNGATAPYHYVDLPLGARHSDANATGEYDDACADRSGSSDDEARQVRAIPAQCSTRARRWRGPTRCAT